MHCPIARYCMRNILYVIPHKDAVLQDYGILLHDVRELMESCMHVLREYLDIERQVVSIWHVLG